MNGILPAGERTLTDHEMLQLILAKMDSVEEMVTKVVTEVGPVVESLSKHPMLKMFIGGKKS